MLSNECMTSRLRNGVVFFRKFGSPKMFLFDLEKTLGRYILHTHCIRILHPPVALRMEIPKRITNTLGVFSF